ncbi:MAG: CCA tRNA nucleotidyltransferase, partial [Deltaproteobacteria bacterium]|nr:CCA tRNA nucleotidyltransferase [Deltaproteobacteria bacterium]
TFLVGGCIRDMLLGRSPSDFDIVTFCDVWEKARQISERFASTAFWMDKERGVARIVIHGSGQTIDVSAPKGADICADLKKRDITINAIGFDAAAGKIIDPLQGINDLRHGVIRVICEENLRDDPLRVVRCLRFSVMLGFAVVETTDVMLKKYAHEVKTVSAERIKQEFMKALSYPSGSRFFSLMDRTGLIEPLFIQDVSTLAGMEVSCIRPALIMACEMDGLIYDARKSLPGIAQALEEEVETGLSRAGLLRLITFLHGMHSAGEREEDPFGAKIPEPAREQHIQLVQAFCGSLKFSSPAMKAAKSIVSCQEHARYILSHNKELTGAELHSLCEEAYPNLPEVLLLAQAKANMGGIKKASGLPERMNAVWSYYVDTYQEHRQCPLISGDDVIHILGLSPGPRVGKVLRMVETARAEGIIASRDEAIEYLRTIAV